MNKMFEKILVFITIMLTMVVLAGPASAKSLYVICDQDSSVNPPTPVRAYRINANGTLTYQTQTMVPDVTGAVGLGIDSTSATLFMSVEYFGTFQIYDALTMHNLGSVTAPGASDLAGIVMDEKKNRLYTVDRDTANLYVYQWNRVTKVLTPVGTLPIVLPTPSGFSDPTAFGIALDTVNDLLYVANGWHDIYIYKTSDWSLAGTGVISLNNNSAYSVAIDSARQLLYTGAGFNNDTLLVQKHIVGGAEKTKDVSTVALPKHGVMGLGIDNATGYVYISTGDGSNDTGDLVVYNTSLNQIQRVANIGISPVGLAIPTSGKVEYRGDITPVYKLLLLY
jgi:hypothetical protein